MTVPASRAAALLAALTLSLSPAAAQTGVTGAAPAGAPAEMLLLPADSQVVFGIHVRGFFASRLWSQLASGELGQAAGLTPEKAAELSREVQSNFDKGMAEMETELGFRADRDVDWVVMAMRNPDAPSPDMAGVATGRFDTTRIMTAMAADAAKNAAKNGVQRSKQAGGVTIHYLEKDGKPGFALAPLAAGQLAFGDLPMVEGLVAAHASRRRPLETSALATRLKAVPAGTGIFMYAAESLFAKMRTSPNPPPMPLPRNMSLRFEFDGHSEIVAEMGTAAEAQQAATAIQGQLGMVGAMMGQDPDPSKAAMGRLLAGFSAAAEGTSLRITSTGGLGMGALAAIAVPSLLRARVSANEASALGDVRTVISAQAAYQSANGGFSGDMACLAAPATCMKGYSGPVFLDAPLAGLEAKSGYRRAFFPGPRAARPRSYRSFAYTAVPVEKGKTGVRSFCGQHDGVVVFDPTGADIQPVGGTCPPGLQPVK